MSTVIQSKTADQQSRWRHDIGALPGFAEAKSHMIDDVRRGSPISLIHWYCGISFVGGDSEGRGRIDERGIP